MRTLGVVVLASLVLLFLLRSTDGPEQPRPKPDPTTDAQHVSSRETGAQGEVASPAATTDVPAQRVEAPGTPAPGLRVLVVDQEDAGVADVVVETARGDGETRLSFWPAGATSVDGELHLTDLEPGWLSVRASDVKKARWVRLDPGRTQELKLVTEPLLPVVGRVLDGNGRPVGGADIWISDIDNELQGRTVTRSAADGGFRVDARGADRVVVARAGGLASAPTPLNRPRLPEEELLVRLSHQVGAVEGRVLDATGSPVPRARLLVGPMSHAPRNHIAMGPYGLDAGRSGDPIASTTITDQFGYFRADAVSCGQQVYVVVRRQAFAPTAQKIEVSPGAMARIEIRLDSGFCVRGTITRKDGKPASDVPIMVDFSALVMAPDRDWLRPGCTTAADGSFTLAGLPAGEWRITALSGRLGRAQHRVKAGTGEEVLWNAVLEPGPTIQGTLRDVQGTALAGWLVGAEEGRHRTFVTTDPDGGFLITQCRTGKYTVTVQQRDAWMPTTVLTTSDVDPDGPPLDLRVPTETLSTSRVTGTVLDSLGRPVPGVISVTVGTQQSAQQMSSPVAGGRFEVAPIRAGRFTITVTLPGHETVAFPTFELGPGQHRELGTMTAVRKP